jgi:superfamily II DNA/RNA helicase
VEPCGRRLLACVLTRLGIAVDELDVHVTPYSTARPVRTFAQLGLDKRLLAEIFAAGYERPTPIQAQTVPIVLSGCDVIALAKTGTDTHCSHIKTC